MDSHCNQKLYRALIFSFSGKAYMIVAYEASRQQSYHEKLCPASGTIHGLKQVDLFNG